MIVQVSSKTKAEHVSPPISDTPQPPSAPVAAPPPKVDYATDLFSMLSMDGPSENGIESSSADDNSWAGFQCKWMRILLAWVLWTEKNSV